MAEKDYKYFKSKTNRGVYIQAPVGTSQEVIERLAKDIPKGTYNVDDLVIGETKRETIPTTKSVPTTKNVSTNQQTQVQPQQVQQATSIEQTTLPTSTAKYVPGQGVVSEDQIKDQQATYQLGQLKQQAQSKQAPVVTEEQKQGYTLQQAGKDFKGGMDAMAHGAVPFLTANIISTPIVNTINEKLGTNFQTPEEGMTELFKRAGIAEPETGAQKMVSGMTDALITTAATAGGAGIAKGAQTLAQKSAPTVSAKVLDVLTDNVPQQLAGAATGVATGMGGEKLATEAGASPEVAQLVGMGTGMLGDVVGSSLFDSLDSTLKSSMKNVDSSTALTKKPVTDITDSTTIAEGAASIEQQKVIDTLNKYGVEPTAMEVQMITNTAPQDRMNKINKLVAQKGGAGEYLFNRFDEARDTVKDWYGAMGFDINTKNPSMLEMSEKLLDDYSTTRGAKVKELAGKKQDIINSLEDGAKARADEIAQAMKNEPIVTQMIKDMELAVAKGDMSPQAAQRQMKEMAETIRNTSLKESGYYVDNADTVQYLREQADLMAGDSDLRPLAQKLYNWADDMDGMTIAQLEEKRSIIGNILDSGEHPGNKPAQLKKSIYGMVAEDIKNHVGKYGEANDLTAWNYSNANLSRLMQDFEGKATKQLLNEVYKDPSIQVPEEISRKLLSGDESQVKQIYDSLSAGGKQVARDLFVLDTLQNQDWVNLSPKQLSTDLAKSAAQQGVMFTPKQRAELEGFTNYLKYATTAEDFVKTGATFRGDNLDSTMAYALSPHNAAGRLAIREVKGKTNILGKISKFKERPEVRNKLLALANNKPGTPKFQQALESLKQIDLGTKAAQASTRTVRNNTPMEEK